MGAFQKKGSFCKINLERKKHRKINFALQGTANLIVAHAKYQRSIISHP